VKNQDEIITPNFLKNIFSFLGTFFIILGFVIWVLLQFQMTYVFVEPLNEFFFIFYI